MMVRNQVHLESSDFIPIGPLFGWNKKMRFGFLTDGEINGDQEILH